MKLKTYYGVAFVVMGLITIGQSFMVYNTDAISDWALLGILVFCSCHAFQNWRSNA